MSEGFGTTASQQEQKDWKTRLNETLAVTKESEKALEEFLFGETLDGVPGPTSEPFWEEYKARYDQDQLNEFRAMWIAYMKKANKAEVPQTLKDQMKNTIEAFLLVKNYEKIKKETDDQIASMKTRADEAEANGDKVEAAKIVKNIAALSQASSTNDREMRTILTRYEVGNAKILDRLIVLSSRVKTEPTPSANPNPPDLAEQKAAMYASEAMKEKDETKKPEETKSSPVTVRSQPTLVKNPTVEPDEPVAAKRNVPTLGKSHVDRRSAVKQEKRTDRWETPTDKPKNRITQSQDWMMRKHEAEEERKKNAANQ